MYITSLHRAVKLNFLLGVCAQWDPKYRIKVRVICARAYHALFMVSFWTLFFPL